MSGSRRSIRIAAVTAVTLLAAFVLPGAAFACPAPPSPHGYLEQLAYEECRRAQEREFREQREQREQQTREREAREKREPTPEEPTGPPTFLKVRAVAIHGHTYRHPGRTRLEIDTDGADVWLKVVFPYAKPEYFHDLESLEYDWSCAEPMLRVNYVARARGKEYGYVEDGPGLVVTGHFVEAVSRKWCNAAKTREKHH
jgi:hypothetical protein